MDNFFGGPVPERLCSDHRACCGHPAAITIVGMEFFLFRFDESRFLKQIFWFVAMLVPLLGASLYCFLVYSRSEVVRSGFQEKPIVTLGT